MKTISLEEAKKLATPGPVRYSPHFWKNAEGHLFFASAGGACTIHLEGAASATQAWLDRHAVLLAHCWNTHDELVEALEKAESWMGLSTREDTERDQAALDIAARECRAVLAKAHTVEMP